MRTKWRGSRAKVRRRGGGRGVDKAKRVQGEREYSIGKVVWSLGGYY
jgi:hypothetical protein